MPIDCTGQRRQRGETARVGEGWPLMLCSLTTMPIDCIGQSRQSIDAAGAIQSSCVAWFGRFSICVFGNLVNSLYADEFKELLSNEVAKQAKKPSRLRRRRVAGTRCVSASLSLRSARLLFSNSLCSVSKQATKRSLSDRLVLYSLTTMPIDCTGQSPLYD